MELAFKINNVTIPFSIISEFKAGDDDLSSDDSGRTLDGMMHKNVVTAKEYYDLSFMPLSWETNAKIMNAVRGKNKVTFTYPSPLFPGSLTTGEFYIQARSTSIFTVDKTGNIKWEGLAFRLAEI